MAERRVSIPVRYSVETTLAGLYGVPTLSGTAVEGGTGIYASAAPRRHFSARARLAWGDSAQGYTVYTSGTGATLTTFTRAPAGLRAINGVRVHTDEPDGTSVLWRVVLDGTAYYWTGAAWAAAVDAGADWCTTAELEANLSTITIADARAGLGFVASLRTTRPDRTPYVYGVEMVWAIHRTTSIVAPLRHEVTHEELRIAIKAGLDALSFAASEEFESDGTATLDFSALGDYAQNVTGIVAVYNLESDPEMDSPLSGAFNTGTRVYTLTAAPTAADRLHVDYQHSPLVSLGGDDDLVTDRMPLIAMGKPALGRSRQLGQWELLEGADGSTVRVGRAPRLTDLTIEARVYARTDTDCETITDQVLGWLTGGGTNPRRGRTFTLPTDGQVITVHWAGAEAPRSRDRYWQQVFRLGAFGVPVYSAEAVGAVSITDVDTGTPEVALTL